MALSLSNRFFWLAGIVFAVSDITGLLRLQFANNKYTYFVTTTIYTVAFLIDAVHRENVYYGNGHIWSGADICAARTRVWYYYNVCRTC